MKSGWIQKRNSRTALIALVVGLASLPAKAGLNDVYWSPEKLSNTVVWLDASDVNMLTTNASGQVSQWNDRSGNSNHFTQGTTSFRPVANGYSIGGLNAIRSDGIDDYLSNTSVPIGSSGEVIIFAVSHILSVDNSADGLFSLVPGFELRAGAASQFTPQYFPGYVDFNGGPYSGTSIYAVAVNTNVLSAWGYVDGAERLSTSSFEALQATTDVSVFAKRGGQAFTGWLSCDIGEVVLVAGDVTLETRQMVEGYLAWKWEIESKLPAEHPFKAAPPEKPPTGTVITLY